MKRDADGGYVTDLPTDQGVNTTTSSTGSRRRGQSGATARAGASRGSLPDRGVHDPRRGTTLPRSRRPTRTSLAPTIRHAAIRCPARPAKPQRFEATVTDADSGVADVTLFHRRRARRGIRRDRRCSRRAATTSTSPRCRPSDEPGTIEYFIEAEDEAGTAGHARLALLAAGAAGGGAGGGDGGGAGRRCGRSGERAGRDRRGGDAAGAEESGAVVRGRRSARAVGLIAGLAGGGGGEDDDDEPMPGGGDCCDVTFVVDTPQ